jgi:sRNA-binding protein
MAARVSGQGARRAPARDRRRPRDWDRNGLVAPYTLGVLAGWKMAAVYCRAVLCYDQRIALDGSPAETVDAEAKDLATKRLAELAARKATKKSANATAPAVVKPTPAPAPPTETPHATPEQLRARVRASLLRRSA